MKTKNLTPTELEEKITEFSRSISLKNDNPNVSRHNLVVHPESKTISFNCSCYTRECTTDKVHGKYNRQQVYISIFSNFVNNITKLGFNAGSPVDTYVYPFGGSKELGYNINLVHEDSNSHDPNAEMLIISANNHTLLKCVDGFNIGYVPGSMSYFFHEYRKYFTNIKIQHIYNNLSNRKDGRPAPALYNLRLSIFYKDTDIFGIPSGMGRFTDI